MTRLHQAAQECAAFAWQMGLRAADGKTVIALCSYARTIPGLSEGEQAAVIGASFDWFVAELRATS